MFELVRRNRRRSALFAVAMLAIVAASGWAAGVLTLGPDSGWIGVLAGAVIAAVLLAHGWTGGNRWLLSRSGARPISKERAPELHNVLEEVCIAAGVSRPPKLYLIESNVPNAFATGRDPESSSIVVTDRLLSLLTRDELQAVIAHELSHVIHCDVRFMTMLAVMLGVVGVLFDVTGRTRRVGRTGGGGKKGGGAAIVLAAVLVLLLGLLLARIVYYAASRTREYLADAGSAVLTRNPLALADALEKLSRRSKAGALPIPSSARAMLIVGAPLFSTHPPIQRRIAVLKALAGAGELDYGSYSRAFESVTGDRARFVPSSLSREGAATHALVSPSRSPQAGRSARREALDAVRADNGYTFRRCACTTLVKVPPALASRAVPCLRCGRQVPARAVPA
jgi:heat shock protein HtpX